MSRRFLQSACILLVFALAIGAVLWLGIREGQTVSLKTHGIELDEKEPWNDVATKPQPEDDTIVYVTEQGTKYHVSKDCSSLKRSKTVIGTPLKTAKRSGKDPCSLCCETE